VQVEGGWDFACALDATGRVFCWGSNSNAQLGLGSEGGPDVVTPTQVTLPEAIGALSAGQTGVIAVSADGESLYAWGRNRYGELGLGPSGPEVQASPLTSLVTPGATLEASLGNAHSCILQTVAGEATPLCAGQNDNFELGMDPAADPTRYTAVPAFE